MNYISSKTDQIKSIFSSPLTPNFLGFRDFTGTTDMAAVASPSRTETTPPYPAEPPRRLASAPAASAISLAMGAEAAAAVAAAAAAAGDAAYEGSSPSSASSGEVSDRRDSDASSSQLLASRSEEYRLLFRLPPDEVLVQDFNCALQENILLQGHMYLFLRHLCFYSNIFGYETKKTILLHEVTVVRKAKTAAIFPNAIEIVAGSKKHFFGSFLFRDEAYRFIIDGWAQQNSEAKAFLERQDSKYGSNSEDGVYILLEGSKEDDLSLLDRNMDVRLSDSQPLANGPAEITNAADIGMSQTVSQVQENGTEDSSHQSPVLNPFDLEPENIDAPKVPEYYTLLAQSKFPVPVEEFFSLFISDRSLNFSNDFRTKCGDKEFQCSPWRQDEQSGLVRDIFFLHPIKLYLGAKFGSCREVQKLRLYRNRHFRIETSQNIGDAPYGDHFTVEGIWNVEPDIAEENSCTLSVFLNVAFSKKTIFKGKIDQSTKDECREVFELWVNLAHEILKRKAVYASKGASMQRKHVKRSEVQSGVPLNYEGSLENTIQTVNSTQDIPDTTSLIPPFEDPLQENLGNFSSTTSSSKEIWATIKSFMRTNQFSLVLVMAFVAFLILMQVTIIILLTRSPKVYMVGNESSMSSLSGYGKESMELLQKRLVFLREEMHMVEAHMERMRHEYAWLKPQLERLERHKSDS